jgi:hypothetical protein
MTRKEREEMKALSKEAFGITSRWSKLLKKGKVTVLSETSVGKKGKKVRHAKMEYFTVGSLKTYMKELINKRAETLEKMKKSVDAPHS